MNRNEETEKLKDALIKKVKSENDSRHNNLSSDKIMKIIIESSNKGKYTLWVLREYLKDNIQRFEDMGRVKQALTLFRNNLSKFTEQEKQLNKMSFQELEGLVEPYQDVLTQNEIKRMNKEKIWEEIDVIYEGPEGRIYIPKNRESSIFLGQGTKWCTASVNNNMFESYNKQGPLYIFVLPEKDEKGREVKYQLHFECHQFMDSEDKKCDLTAFNDDYSLVDKIFSTFSTSKKFELLIESNLFFAIFHKKPEFDDFIEDILVEKIKLGDFVAIINKFPRELITTQLCEKAVLKHGQYLEYIPKNMITEKLCKMAVQNNSFAIRHVEDIFFSQELCEIAVKKDGRSLANIVKRKNMFNSLDMRKICKIAIENDSTALEYVPRLFKTKELCEMAIANKPKNLHHTPTEYITPEICLKAMQKDGMSLGYVPEKFKTKELCELAVKQNGNALRYVTKEMITPQLCETAVKQDGLALEYVPPNMVSETLYDIAVKQNGLALKHVPLAKRTFERFETAVKQNGMALGYVLNTEIKDKLWKDKLCKVAIEQNGKALMFIPAEMRTQEICEIAVKQDGDSLSSVPLSVMTKELCEIAIENDYLNLFHVSEKLQTKEMMEKSLDVLKAQHHLEHTNTEIIKMMFDLDENPVKTILYRKYGYTRFFKDSYIEITVSEILDKIKYQNTNNII